MRSMSNTLDMLVEDARCPACGEGIDWCQGHGVIGDPGGAIVLDNHDAGRHAGCHPAGCEAAALRLSGGAS